MQKLEELFEAVFYEVRAEVIYGEGTGALTNNPMPGGITGLPCSWGI
jgi:hypothetical protein